MKRYKVTYQVPGMQEQTMIADLLSVENKKLWFSLRPIAGTTVIEKHWVRNMVQVDDNTPIKVSR